MHARIVTNDPRAGEPRSTRGRKSTHRTCKLTSPCSLQRNVLPYAGPAALVLTDSMFVPDRE